METSSFENLWIRGRSFSFPMERKPETFGDLTIDHCWIAAPLLDPRDEPAPDSPYRSFCEAFRTICMNDKSDLKLAAEAYALARLRPHTRSRGALSVFLDAKEGSVAHKNLRGNDAELQSMLTSDPLHPMSAAEFHKALLQHQQRPTYSEEEGELYRRMEKELLGDVAELWLYGNRPDVAYETVLKRWKELDKKFGRRAGFEKEKTVLDAISYEAAVAFRRCYSAVWSTWILPSLQSHPVHNLSRHSYRFLEFWHLQIAVVDRDHPETPDFPFHGEFLRAGRLCGTLP